MRNQERFTLVQRIRRGNFQTGKSAAYRIIKSFTTHHLALKFLRSHNVKHGFITPVTPNLNTSQFIVE